MEQMHGRSSRAPRRLLGHGFGSLAQEAQEMQQDDHDYRYACQPEDDVAEHELHSRARRYGATAIGKVEASRNGVVPVVAALDRRPPRRCE